MTAMQWIGGVLFGVALLHTFSTKFFERMAHRRPDHAGVWHLLGEVEVVFGFWAMVLHRKGTPTRVALEGKSRMPCEVMPHHSFHVI